MKFSRGKIFGYVWFCLLWLLAAGAAGAQVARMQLVESVPVETNLGSARTPSTLPVWLEMIEGAKFSLDIEIFYLSNKTGEPLQKIIDAIRNAAGRGVRTRILVDARMANTYPETLKELSSQANIFVRRIEEFNRQGGVQHAKYFIVDKREIFVGSQNFDWRALKHIHELGVRIENEKLAELIGKIFELDWELAGKPAASPPPVLQPLSGDEAIDSEHPIRVRWKDDSVSVYPTFSPYGLIYPGMSADEAEILRLICSARRTVEVQLLTYSPEYDGEYYAAIEVALREAAARKVQVKLLTSNWNKRKPGVDYLKSLQVLANLQVKFSNIPAYSGGFIPYARVEHCKYLVVDDSLCWIGTANWARDYFYHSRNLGLVIVGASVSEVVKEIFLKSWDGPYAEEVNPCREYEVPRIGR